MGAGRLPQNQDAAAAEVEKRADTVLRAIFFHFNKNQLSMDGSILVLAAAYAMVLNQAKDEKQKKELVKLFEQMTAKAMPSKIIKPGQN